MSEKIKGKNGEQQEKISTLFAEYTKELEKPEYNVLSKEEEKVLITRYREHGDIDARQEIVKHNLRLVPFLIKKYNIYTSDIMDLIQVGNIALVEAVENFNPAEDVKFGSYAMYIVKKYILNAVSSDINKVYIPFGMTNNVNKYKRMMAEANKKEIDLTDEEILKELNIKPETLKTLRKAAAIDYVSMSVPILANNEEKIYVSDIIADERVGDLASGLIAEENLRILDEALESLNPREYDIVTHLFGLNCEKQSSRVLAEKYGISMERICQIRKHACMKMQKYFNKQKIYSFES